MLKTKSISFSYSSEKSFQFPDIICESGNQLLLLGESGKGKTTLLHILAGLLKPNSGKVLINETDIVPLKNHQLDLFRGKNIGIVFQTSHFIQAISVIENILLAAKFSGIQTTEQDAMNLLQRLNIEDRAKLRPSKLSVGEQQRAAIARALICKPDVILADEPTSALDDKNATAVIEMLKEQSEAVGASLIIVTHDKRLKDQFTNTITL